VLDGSERRDKRRRPCQAFEDDAAMDVDEQRDEIWIAKTGRRGGAVAEEEEAERGGRGQEREKRKRERERGEGVDGVDVTGILRLIESSSKAQLGGGGREPPGGPGRPRDGGSRT
jgi:hypothetical protein